MMTEFMARLRFLLFRKKRNEMDEELRFHLEQSIAAKLAAGFTADEARRQALIEFGGVSAPANSASNSVPGSGSTRSPRMCATVSARCANRLGLPLPQSLRSRSA